MVPLIQIMILPAMIQSISHIASPVLIALGKSKLSLHINVGGALFYFATLMGVIPYGLKAVAYGYTVANSIIGIVTLVLALRYAKIPMIEFMRAIGRPLTLAFLMMAAILAIQPFFPAGSYLRLSASIMTGAVVFAGMVFFFEKKAWQQVLHAFRAKT